MVESSKIVDGEEFLDLKAVFSLYFSKAGVQDLGNRLAPQNRVLQNPSCLGVVRCLLAPGQGLGG